MNILLYILIIVVALCIGFIVGRTTVRADGMFIVDDTDNEVTRWVLDVKIDPKDIPNKKEVRLKVRKMIEGDV